VKVIKGLPAEWGECSRTVLLSSPPWSLSYHKNTIAVGSEHGNIIILDAITGSQTGVLSGHTKMVQSLIFSSNGALLVSGSWDCTVKLWDIQTGGVIKTFSGHNDWVGSVSISADCTRIASRSTNGTINLWDIQTGECHHTIQQQINAYDVCFSPTDPQHLLFVSDEKVWQWDINCHQIMPLFNGNSIAFSSDGTQFVTCYEGVATVHNSNSGAVMSELQVTDVWVHFCCFSPDGRLVAGVDSDTVYIWNITNSNPHLVRTSICHTRYITSLVFSSPFSLISASEDKSVKIWQIGALSTGSVVTDPNPVSTASATLQSTTLQAKYGITITSDSDGMVKTWDISTGLCKASYQTPAKGYGLQRCPNN
jgi:WD40 repeat protein